MSHLEDVEPEQNLEKKDDQQTEKTNDHQGVYEAARRYAESWVPPTTLKVEQARAREKEAQRDCYEHARQFVYVTPHSSIDEERYQGWRPAYDDIPEVWKAGRREAVIKMERCVDRPALPGMTTKGIPEKLRKGEFEQREVQQYWIDCGYMTQETIDDYHNKTDDRGPLEEFSDEDIEQLILRLEGKYTRSDGTIGEIGENFFMPFGSSTEFVNEYDDVNVLAALVREALEEMRQALEDADMDGPLENFVMPNMDEFDEIEVPETDTPEEVLAAQREATKILEREFFGDSIPEGLSPEEMKQWFRESFELQLPLGYRHCLDQFPDDPVLEQVIADEKSGVLDHPYNAPDFDPESLDWTVDEEFEELWRREVANTHELFVKAGVFSDDVEVVVEEVVLEKEDEVEESCSDGPSDLGGEALGDAGDRLGFLSSRFAGLFCHAAFAGTALCLFQPTFFGLTFFRKVRPRCRSPTGGFWTSSWSPSPEKCSSTGGL